jgi:hypothetical protein
MYITDFQQMGISAMDRQNKHVRMGGEIIIYKLCKGRDLVYLVPGIILI